LSFFVATRIKKLLNVRRSFSSNNNNCEKESLKNTEEINVSSKDLNPIFDIHRMAKNYFTIFVILTTLNFLFIGAIYFNLVSRGYPTDHYFMQVV